MKLAGRSLRRAALVVLASGLAIGLGAPYWNLDRYRRQIQATLERELHRKVEVGKARLQLIRGPGFSLSDVIIYDHPRVGREPLAYVTELQARVAVASLWAGRLRFASLRLVEPSLNLVKPANGRWNFEEILERAFATGVGERPPLPHIQVRGGRINFKFGDTKAVFYLANADVDIAPPASREGSWELRFSGEPARTDRPAHGLGQIAARARLHPGMRAEAVLEVERGYLEELSALLAGRDLGLRGRLSARARLSGPLEALEITGSAQLRDFRRWDLLPPAGGDWNLSYRGWLNLPAQRLSLEAQPEATSAVKFHWRLYDYLAQPRWGLLVNFEALPVNQLVQALRVIGISFPEAMRVEGLASGGVGFSSTAALEASFVVRDAIIHVPGWPTLRCARAPVTVQGGKVQLGPWKLEWRERGTGTFEAIHKLAEPGMSAKLSASAAPIPAPGTSLLPSSSPVPVLAACRGGAWEGALRYAQAEGDGRWNGQIELRDTELDVSGVASPVRIARARLRLENGSTVLEISRATLGRLALEGSYSAKAGAEPASIRLHFPELDLAELERLLAPTLDRRRGLLGWAWRLRRGVVPAWLAQRRLEGTFEIAKLRLQDQVLGGPAEGSFKWQGERVQLGPLRVRSGEAVFRGRIQVDLRRATPAYRATGVLASCPWLGGLWSVEGSLETAGLGSDLLENLRAQIAFLGRSVRLEPDQEFESIAGRLAFDFARRGPRLKLAELEAAQGGRFLRGECRPLPGGRWLVELSGPAGHLRWLATLWPPKLEDASTH